MHITYILSLGKRGGAWKDSSKITLIRPCVTLLVVSFIMCMHSVVVVVVVHCLSKNYIKYIPHINLIPIGEN